MTIVPRLAADQRTVSWDMPLGATWNEVVVHDLDRYDAQGNSWADYIPVQGSTYKAAPQPGQFLSVSVRAFDAANHLVDETKDTRDQVQVWNVAQQKNVVWKAPLVGLCINANGNGNRSAWKAYRSWQMTGIRVWRENFTVLNNAFDAIVRMCRNLGGRLLYTAMIGSSTPDQYGNLISQVVSTYEAGDHYPLRIEDSNEPLGNVYQMLPEEYCDYVIAAGTACRHTSTRSAQTLAAFDTGYGGYDYVIGRSVRYCPDIARYFGGGALHPYPQPALREITPFREWVIRDFMKAFPGKVSYLTEIGIATTSASVPVLTGNTAPGVTEAEQQAWVLDAFNLARTYAPVIGSIFFYMDADLNPQPPPVPPKDKSSELFFGVCTRKDGSRKPALSSIRAIAQ